MKIVIAFIVLSILHFFLIAKEAQRIADRKGELLSFIESKRIAIKELQVEWSVLNSPYNLDVLNSRYLKLSPVNRLSSLKNFVVMDKDKLSRKL